MYVMARWRRASSAGRVTRANEVPNLLIFAHYLVEHCTVFCLALTTRLEKVYTRVRFVPLPCKNYLVDNFRVTSVSDCILTTIIQSWVHTGSSTKS